MRKVIIGLIVVALSFLAHGKFRQSSVDAGRIADNPVERPAAAELLPELPARTYRCDSRVYCSQMTSCEEATWFLRNCSGVKMDGEGDGVPCEKQWCGVH